MRRRWVVAIVLILMAGFGVGVNRWFALHKANLDQQQAVDPVNSKPLLVLPGTIYLSQGGQIFALSDGAFKPLNLPATDAEGLAATWGQPVVLPNDQVLAIKRGFEYSDLYQLTATGGVVQQLTNDYVGNTPALIGNDHWIQWPHLTADGQTLFYSYDSPKLPGTYEVDYNIWSAGLNGQPIATASKRIQNGTVRDQRWTTPNYYTGGDTDPMPLSNGSLLYVEYSIGGDGKVYSQLALQKAPKAKSVTLTTPDQDCNAAALSPDQTTVAMICSADKQTVSLEVAHFNGTVLSPATTLVDNCLCASPAWASDGSGLVYIAPNDATGHFQLWWIDKAATAPVTPKQVTDNLDLDATSPPAWSIPAASGTTSRAP